MFNTSHPGSPEPVIQTATVETEIDLNGPLNDKLNIDVDDNNHINNIVTVNENKSPDNIPASSSDNNPNINNHEALIPSPLTTPRADQNERDTGGVNTSPSPASNIISTISSFSSPQGRGRGGDSVKENKAKANGSDSRSSFGTCAYSDCGCRQYSPDNS